MKERIIIFIVSFIGIVFGILGIAVHLIDMLFYSKSLIANIPFCILYIGWTLFVIYVIYDVCRDL